MYQQITPPPKKEYVDSSILIYVAFCTAFFPRILNAVGAPSAINFLHFAVVPLVLAIILTTAKPRMRDQIAVSRTLFISIVVFFGVFLISALINSAGLINAVLDFLMLSEPFLLLLAIVYIPISRSKLSLLKKLFLASCLINLLLAFVQWPLLVKGVLSTKGMGLQDAVQGVFYITGAGNYVSATLSICAGTYFFSTFSKIFPIWVRVSVLAATFWQIILADCKQIILALGLAWVLLVIIRSQNITQALKYLITLILVSAVFLFCVQNIPDFSAYNAWARPELYGLDGEATHAKIAGIRIILSFHKSFLNLLFGLGPGHTIGRLGGWLLRDYWDLLGPLGATTHPASQAVWDAANSDWLNQSGGSTIFSPFFTWAGIWGDLGFVGLGVYLYLAFVVWHCFCSDDLPRFWLLSILIIGLIFTQMEEPGYMLSMAFLIGVRWQEKRMAAQNNFNSRTRGMVLLTSQTSG